MGVAAGAHAARRAYAATDLRTAERIIPIRYSVVPSVKATEILRRAQDINQRRKSCKNLFEISAQNLHDAIHVFFIVADLIQSGRIDTGAEGFPEMTFHHFNHQSVGRPPHRSDLLEKRGAIVASLNRTLQRIGLPLDAAEADYGLLLVFR